MHLRHLLHKRHISQRNFCAAKMVPGRFLAGHSFLNFWIKAMILKFFFVGSSFFVSVFPSTSVFCLSNKSLRNQAFYFIQILQTLVKLCKVRDLLR